MNPERWRKVKRIFQSALECAPGDRDEYLIGACSGDELLRMDIESLLLSDERAGDFIEESAFEVAAKALEERQATSVVGRQVGPYNVVGEISRGGMGVVYLAVRADDQYQKRVAIKLIRRGVDTADMLRHFRRERQILANLEHPNIARLLDGGTAEDGLPYIVMEYIEGEPIDEYCDRRTLTVVERLKLFRTVCSAVQYAHQCLVIHRDLKPDNILVTAEGVPKLLDFGIAKLLDLERPSQTHDGATTVLHMLTPEYASPEQIRGERVTTASDVYSLGILLYVLLTGQRPYRLGGRTPYQLAMAICDSEPERPSVAVGRVGEAPGSGTAHPSTLTPESVGKARGTQPDRLRRRLRGDLDNIVLTAINKKPALRYASVNQLSDDIRLHLEGMPVCARKDTFLYRTGKLVRRNRAALALASAVAIMALGFVISVVAESNRTARERDKAQRVSAFLVNLFQVSDPSEAKGENVTAREILDQGAGKIASELEGQPDVQAMLMHTMGQVYFKLGNLHRAESLLGTVLSIRRRTLGDEHPDTAEALYDLARVHSRKYDLEAAEPLFREALAVQRRLLGNDHPAVASTLGDYAQLLLSTKRDYATAEQMYREALEIQSNAFGEEHRAVAETLNDLGELMYEKGDMDASEELHLKALSMRRKLLGNDHPDVAQTMQDLAWTMRMKGDYAASETLFRQAISVKRKVWPDGHQELATSLVGLGLILLDKGQPIDAELPLREGVDMRRRMLPAGAWETAVAESDLGACLSAQRRYAEAESLLLRSYEILKAKGGERERRTLEALSRIITLYQSWGKGDRAAEYRFRFNSSS